MRREEEQEEERKERTWKRKSPTVGVRVAWVGLNRCVHQSTAEKAHEFVAFGVRAADSAPSRTFGALLGVSLRDVHHHLAREFESSSACMCLARLWAFMAFDFFRFEWQARWWQKWILRFLAKLAWFLLSRFFTIIASLLSLVVLSLAFLYFRLFLSSVLSFLMFWWYYCLNGCFVVHWSCLKKCLNQTCVFLFVVENEYFFSSSLLRVCLDRTYFAETENLLLKLL